MSSEHAARPLQERGHAFKELSGKVPITPCSMFPREPQRHRPVNTPASELFCWRVAGGLPQVSLSKTRVPTGRRYATIKESGRSGMSYKLKVHTGLREQHISKMKR